MEDYIMLIDENGQPYIAHAGMLSNAASGVRQGVGRGVRQVHKYIMKIGEGAQARYFYTQDEIRAYQQEMANKAKGAVNDVKQSVKRASGLEARERAMYAKSDGKIYNGYQTKEAYEYSRTPAGKIENAYRNAVGNRIANQRRINETRNKNRELRREQYGLKWTDNKTGQQISGKEAREQLRNAAKQAGKLAAKGASENIKNTFNNAQEQVTKKTRQLTDNAADTADRIREKAQGKIRGGSETTKSTFDRMKNEFRERASEKAERAKDAASNAANKVKDTASKAVETAKDKAGFDERRRRDEAWDNIGKQAMGSEDREKAWDEFRKADNEYSKTALGKLKNADYKAAEKIDDAVWNTINKLNIKGKDVHDRYSAAREEERRNPTEENKRKAEELWDEYLKTPHAKLAFSTSGIVENGVAGNAGRLASNAASKIKDISESQAKKIRQKLNSGMDVAQEDLRALWRYYSNK